MILDKKFKDFIQDNPEITMVSLSWSLYWRLWLLFMGIYLGVLLIIGILAFLFSA